MNIIIWIVIYIVLSTILGLFLFKEKQIIGYFKEKEKILAEKIENVSEEKKNRDKNFADILTILGIIILFIFFLIVDKTPDSAMPLKVTIIFLVFGSLLVNLIIRKYHEYMILLSFIMLILARLLIKK